MTQIPDAAPGHYYVTARLDGIERTAFVSGPYDNHPEALALVDRARNICNDYDPRTCFHAFGTARIPLGVVDTPPTGKLQQVGYNLQLTERTVPNGN